MPLKQLNEIYDLNKDGNLSPDEARAGAEVATVVGDLEARKALLKIAKETEERDRFEDLAKLQEVLREEDKELKREWAQTAREAASGLEGIAIHDDKPKNALDAGDEGILASMRGINRRLGATEDWAVKQSVPGVFAGYKMLRFAGRVATMPVRVAWDAFKWVGGLIDDRMNKWSEGEFRPLRWMNAGLDRTDEKLEESREASAARWRGEAVKDKGKKK